MSSPDWAAYPYKPYPPFKDPADWRGAVGGMTTERDHLRARQFAADATDDHVGKHDRHDHPWCEKCYIRTDNYEQGADAPQPPAALNERLREITDERPNPSKIEKIREMFLDDVWTPKPGDGKAFGISDEALDTWCVHLSRLDDWEVQQANAKADTISRTCRYLLVHNRPPVDDFDPEAETGSFDDEFLDRCDLDDLPTPEPLIEGVLPRHAYIILRGRDGTLKSFAELDWALCLATGKRWQGRFTEKVRVLYIAGEGAYGLAARVRAWEQAWGIEVPDNMFTVRKSALNMYKPGPAFDHLLDEVSTGEYGLVIIDTLRRVSGSADGNGSDMGAVVDNIDRIKRATLDGSVSVVSHTDKGDNDSRGYSGIEDDADVVWHAKRNEMDLALTNTKMKDGPDGHTINLRAKIVGDSLVLEASDGTDSTKITESQIQLLDTLRSIFPDGAASGKILKASGLADATYYRGIAALREAGHVLNTGTKQRPFYEMVRTGDSHPLSSDQTTSDLHDYHDSHSLSPAPLRLSSLSPPLQGDSESQAREEATS